MNKPTVTEITRSLEPVAHDTFIDDLTPRVVPRAGRLRPQQANQSPSASAAPAPAERAAQMVILPLPELPRAA